MTYDHQGRRGKRLTATVTDLDVGVRFFAGLDAVQPVAHVVAAGGNTPCVIRQRVLLELLGCLAVEAAAVDEDEIEKSIDAWMMVLRVSEHENTETARVARARLKWLQGAPLREAGLAGPSYYERIVELDPSLKAAAAVRYLLRQLNPKDSAVEVEAAVPVCKALMHRNGLIV